MLIYCKLKNKIPTTTIFTAFVQSQPHVTEKELQTLLFPTRKLNNLKAEPGCFYKFPVKIFFLALFVIPLEEFDVIISLTLHNVKNKNKAKS